MGAFSKHLSSCLYKNPSQKQVVRSLLFLAFRYWFAVCKEKKDVQQNSAEISDVFASYWLQFLIHIHVEFFTNVTVRCRVKMS